MSYRRYANVETNLFPELARIFSETGELDPVDFWAILSWKANRSKTKHLKRMTSDGRTFSEATKAMAREIYSATTPKDRLDVLMSIWSFKLPTATAILTILYPDEFTVYDVRVCKELKAFTELKHQRFSDDLWAQYQAFKTSAMAAVPAGLSLRETDHYLWGRSWYDDASRDIGLAKDAAH